MHHSSSPGLSKKHSCTPPKTITPKRIRTLSPMKHSPASFSANDNTTSSNPEDDDTTIVNEKTTTCTQYTTEQVYKKKWFKTVISFVIAQLELSVFCYTSIISYILWRSTLTIYISLNEPELNKIWRIWCNLCFSRLHFCYIYVPICVGVFELKSIR